MAAKDLPLAQRPLDRNRPRRRVRVSLYRTNLRPSRRGREL